MGVPLLRLVEVAIVETVGSGEDTVKDCTRTGYPRKRACEYREGSCIATPKAVLSIIELSVDLSALKGV